jgi:hypothetical protein
MAVRPLTPRPAVRTENFEAFMVFRPSRALRKLPKNFNPKRSKFLGAGSAGARRDCETRERGQ